MKLSIQLMPVLSRLFYLGFYHSPLSPSLSTPSAEMFFVWSLELPQLFQLSHRYLGLVIKDNNTYCCIMAVKLPLRHNSTCFWEKIEPGGRCNSKLKARLVGKMV